MFPAYARSGIVGVERAGTSRFCARLAVTAARAAGTAVFCARPPAGGLLLLADRDDQRRIGDDPPPPVGHGASRNSAFEEAKQLYQQGDSVNAALTAASIVVEPIDWGRTLQGLTDFASAAQEEYYRERDSAGVAAELRRLSAEE